MKFFGAGLFGVVALTLLGCSSGTPVYEETDAFGVPVDTAVVTPGPNGTWKTVQGTPMVVDNGEVEPDSMLPYGGGNSGIRAAEDESPEQAWGNENQPAGWR